MKKVSVKRINLLKYKMFFKNNKRAFAVNALLNGIKQNFV